MIRYRAHMAFWLFLLGLGSYFSYHLIHGPRSLLSIPAYRQTLDELEEKIEQYEERRDALKACVSCMDNTIDATLLEICAWQRLGYIEGRDVLIPATPFSDETHVVSKAA